MVNFGKFLKTWSLRSNSVIRQVSFNRTKIGGKCQNSNATFWVIFKPCASILKFCHFQSLIERRDIQLSGLVDVYQDRQRRPAALPSGDFAVRFTRVLMRFIKEMEVPLHAFAASWQKGCNICKRAFLLSDWLLGEVLYFFHLWYLV